MDRDDLRRVRADASCPIVRRDAEAEIVANGGNAFDRCLGVLFRGEVMSAFETPNTVSESICASSAR